MLAGDPQHDDTSSPFERRGFGGRIRHRAARLQFRRGEIADPNEEIVQPVAGPHPVLVIEMLKLTLDLVQCVRIEQLAQLRVAKQFAQLALIDRECLCAPFGQRRVAVVDVVRDVAEEQDEARATAPSYRAWPA